MWLGAIYLVARLPPHAADDVAAVRLCIANGALGRTRRGEVLGGLIFWESEVGESAMPRGPIKKLKQMQRGLAVLQHRLGQLATALEKSQNLLNGSDPAVTAAATCALCVVCAFVSVN